LLYAFQPKKRRSAHLQNVLLGQILANLRLEIQVVELGLEVRGARWEIGYRSEMRDLEIPTSNFKIHVLVSSFPLRKGDEHSSQNFLYNPGNRRNNINFLRFLVLARTNWADGCDFTLGCWGEFFEEEKGD